MSRLLLDCRNRLKAYEVALHEANQPCGYVECPNQLAKPQEPT